MRTPSLSQPHAGYALFSPPARTEGLQAAINRLFDRINYERISPGKYQIEDFELSRMRRLLELLEDPHLATPCVHIAGTKGKGSTASMLASVLTAAGHRTGLFTSPHIHCFEERVTIDRTWTDPELLAASFEAVWQAVDQLDAGGEHATYFEITTALAWDTFHRAECDVAVIEVGLGGRLDSTNLCAPLVTAITSISRDHTKLLGDSIAAIAAEKAGIFKAGVPAISGAGEEAAQTIEAIAGQLGCDLWTLGRDVRFSTVGDEPLGCRQLSVTTPIAEHADLPLVLPGAHQSHNGAIVAAICDRLPESLRPSEDALRDGLQSVVCPLRVEVMSTKPYVVLDAAHNGASVAALLSAVSEVPARSRRLVFGTSRDKHLDDMLASIAVASSDGRPFFDDVVIAEYSTNPRALPAEELAAEAREQLGSDVTVAGSPADAIERVMARSTAEDLVVVTGSFFLSGEIREYLLRNRAEDGSVPVSSVAEPAL